MGEEGCNIAVVVNEPSVKIGKTQETELFTRGVGHSTTDRTLAGSGVNCHYRITKPRKMTDGVRKLHFSAFKNSWFSRRCWIMRWAC